MKQMYSDLLNLKNIVCKCEKCPLCKTRNNVVFGEGKNDAKLMIIAEAPGGDEDKLGKPFVGRAGKLLDEVFLKVGIDRKDIYISNIVKCRPPQNRNPEQNEILSCLDYLRNQVMIIKPKIIVLLGSIALKNILGNNYFISKCRGNWIEKRGIKYMPTWHPAAILRDINKKDDIINDFKKVVNELNKL